MNFTTPYFDKPKQWIKQARESKISWDEIRKGYGYSSVDDFLAQMIRLLFWPSIDKGTWESLVDYMMNEEQQSRVVSDTDNAATIWGTDQDNALSVPQSETSAWQIYKEKLLIEKEYDESTVSEIENSCLGTLKGLSRNTMIDDPRKGLVVGSVQSGKTGHMAGLMAMAADWGWNMFIIFSGSIESLREQTEKRLIGDLNNVAAHFTWIPLPRPAKNGFIAHGFNTSQLNLAHGSHVRYLTVCLKNAVRMDNLLDWIQSDQNVLHNMRILIIDDEADQATINTKTQPGERTRLNDSLCKLVNGLKKDGVKSRGFGAMNYVAYTATPYANLLNESGRESLYPRHFIKCLNQSKEYFGPSQIFGVPGSSNNDGIDIVRVVDDTEVDYVKDLYKEPIILPSHMPEGLADSLCWFLCCVASQRLPGKKCRPYSMLIHTSMNTDHHEVVAELVSKWLLSDRSQIIDRCRDVWTRETLRFGLNELKNQYPSYSRLGRVNDYEDFDNFLPFINELLDEVKAIQIDSSGVISYHKGLHLCIDNSKAVGDVDEYIRLLYPETPLNFASAFIVVGGNTLSRGLTIEGLVSTYFFRTASQADTLMQMGRWFGYRRGYELLPRIWMPQSTWDNFVQLSVLDQELRSEIKRMGILGLTPDRYAVRLRTFPSYAKMKITAKNRMQAAEEADMDFSGTLLQTFVFDNDAKILTNNLKLTDGFISSLGQPSSYNSISSENKIWEDVRFDLISKYLKSYSFHQSITRLNDIDPLLEWIEKMHNLNVLNNWNVVLCGVGNSNTYNIGGISVGKVMRSKLDLPDKSLLNIKVLTNPSDFISDLDKDKMNQKVKDMIASREDTRAIRSVSNLSHCPQLLIYIIDKDSTARVSSNRLDLCAPEDIVGIAINIPGHTDCYNNVRTVRVKL